MLLFLEGPFFGLGRLSVSGHFFFLTHQDGDVLSFQKKIFKFLTYCIRYLSRQYISTQMEMVPTFCKPVL